MLAYALLPRSPHLSLFLLKSYTSSKPQHSKYDRHLSLNTVLAMRQVLPTVSTRPSQMRALRHSGVKQLLRDVQRVPPGAQHACTRHGARFSHALSLTPSCGVLRFKYSALPVNRNSSNVACDVAGCLSFRYRSVSLHVSGTHPSPGAPADESLLYFSSATLFSLQLELNLEDLQDFFHGKSCGKEK